MASVMPHNKDFLELCLTVGIEGRDRNYDYDQLQEGVAYPYNGLMLFMNANYLYLTVYNDLTVSMLKSMGYSIAPYGSLGVPDVKTTDYVPTRIAGMVDSCLKSGIYDPEKIKNLIASNSEEIRMSLAFQCCPVLNDKAKIDYLLNVFFETRNIGKVIESILANSPYLNRSQYIQKGFNNNPDSKIVDLLVENYYSQSQTTGKGRN